MSTGISTSGLDKTPGSVKIEQLKTSIKQASDKKNWEYVKKLSLSFFSEGNHDPVILEQVLTACLSISPKPTSVGSAIAGGLGRVNAVMGGGAFDFGKEIVRMPGSIRDNSFLIKFFRGVYGNEKLAQIYLPSLGNWFYMHRAEFDVVLLKEIAQYFSQKESPLEDLGKAKILYGGFSDPDSQHTLRGIEARISMVKSTDADGKLIEADAGRRIASEQDEKRGLTPEQLEKKRDNLVLKYNQDNTDIGVIKELAGVYEELEDWESAQKFYEWAYSRSSADNSLKVKAHTMEEKLLLQKIGELEAVLEYNPQNAIEITALQGELGQKQLEHAQFLVDQNPTDLKGHLTLGKALFASIQQESEGKKELLHIATIHVQRALKDPEKGNEARLLLAEIFSSQSLYDIALHHLDAIIDKEDGMTTLRKKVLYSKGTILEKSGKTDEAKKCFGDIFAYDCDFLDVADKVLGKE